ncbi:hypothetical protein [Pseudomonas benzenivorans]|uniref:Uncharacterized protein n=1 Tax=Pseudomonas benzenivorans TaxID=556533 RepID=A0ABY5H3Z7_9PSED|nr:hypothetical protein [Pseudomonas benzenivorans]UTW06199.1 hypothetical protein KDW96_13500 [Pseudomonas benzenivorans]
MKLPPLGPWHWLVFVAVASLFFAWGAWLVRAAQPAAPLPWLAEWQTEVLAPLADERLRLAELGAQVGGELWLQPRPDGARLLYRGDWRTDGETWRLEAEIALTEAERESLMAAAGLGGDDAEQPLAAALLAQLGHHGIISLTLEPVADVPVERVGASLGQPRLRLQLAEGEAWVYPDLGLTAHAAGEQLRLLQVVPRRALRAR